MICTTDVHGQLLPYDFLRQEDDSVGLANIYSYVKEARLVNPGGVMMLDGGDLIEGTPYIRK